MATKYLSDDQLIAKLGEVKFESIEFSSQDTIDEEEICKSIGDQSDIMFAITAQFAIIGYGGRSFEKFIYNGEEKDLKATMTSLNINFKNEQSAKLQPGDLTPRRLIRVFRSHIQRLLEERNEIASYLFRKYTDKNPEMRTLCFPGAEHIITDPSHAKYLYNAYLNLDKSLEAAGKQHGLAERVERVFLARGIQY